MRVLHDSSMRGGYPGRRSDAVGSPTRVPAGTLLRRSEYDPAMRERLRAALDDMAWRDQGE